MEQFFKLFSDCIPVRGIGRGVICDLSQQRYRFIPLELFDVLALADKFSIYTLNQMFPDVELFLNLFIKENYGFLCDENELSMFPKL
ncbi:MAG TPA: hypothetical protein PJ990_19600 [Saprospiraceae bacterium]|nr:hypothetical protein [Saprospiraceae bacterium]